MKTAMSELIDWIELGTETSVFVIRDKAKELLEKEKEQIIDAYEAAMERPIENFAEGYYSMNYKDGTWNK